MDKFEVNFRLNYRLEINVSKYFFIGNLILYKTIKNIFFCISVNLAIIYDLSFRGGKFYVNYSFFIRLAINIIENIEREKWL